MVAGSCSQYCRKSLVGDIGAVAHADEGRNAHIQVLHMLQNGQSHGAALGKESHIPGAGIYLGKGGIESYCGSVLMTPMQLGPTSRMP